MIGRWNDDAGAGEDAAGNAATVDEHVVKGDFAGVFHSHSDHCEAVADEDHFDPGGSSDGGGGEVMGCKHA